MMGLTEAQRELFDFIRTHKREHGLEPTFDKIRISLGYSNKGCIHKLVSVLIEKGYLVRGRYYGPIKLAQPQYDHGPDCLCMRCPARRERFQQIVQALQVPAPNLPFVGLRPLGHLDRLNWSRFDHNDRSKSSFRRAKPSQTSLDQIPGRAI